MKELPWDVSPSHNKEDNKEPNHIEYSRNKLIRECKSIENIETLKGIIGEEITLFFGCYYHLKYEDLPNCNALIDVFSR